jgi:nucleoside-diphosphate-sugar epimerase
MTAVLISGVNGFIGGHLAAHFARLGWTVIGAGRRQASPACCTDFYVRPFGSSWNEIFDKHAIDAVIHCAHDSSPQHVEATERGTTQWIEETRNAGVARQIFLSSISARADSCSVYGQVKHRLEGQIRARGGLVLRPGLVIGPGGLFARIVRLVENLPLMPMIAGGRNRVYFTGIDALCRIVTRCLDAGPATGAWNVQQPEPTTTRALVRMIGAELGIRRLLVPIPYAVCLAAARVLPSRLLARTGISYENVVGLKQNDVPDLPSNYAALGGQIEDLGVLVARTIHGSSTLLPPHQFPVTEPVEEAMYVGNDNTA